jgi:hypothetical protein
VEEEKVPRSPSLPCLASVEFFLFSTLRGELGRPHLVFGGVHKELGKVNKTLTTDVFARAFQRWL